MGAGLPRGTEAERQVIQRIGQDRFRYALMLYWSGRRPLAGITDSALLRGSQIIHWKDCATDAERLDANNGLLFSSLWDAAFDGGWVSVEDDGTPIASPLLSARPITGLTLGQRTRLAIHRNHFFRHTASS